MKIALERFAGMIPRRHPRLLPDVAAESAENTKLWSGKLKPWLGNEAVCDPFQTLPRSIYLFGKNALPPGFWFQFSETEVDVVKGQVGGDETERTYFTGGPQGRPQVTDKFLAVRGFEEVWETLQHYTIGNIIIGTSTSGVYFECTTAGTAQASEPTWDTGIGNTTADGSVIWTTRTLTPSTICSQLPDQTVNLGIPAPTGAPRTERKLEGGNIVGFESEGGTNRQEKFGSDSQVFTITGDGSSQTLSLNYRCRIRTADIMSGASIQFRLFRDTLSGHADEETVAQANFDTILQAIPNQNETGLVIHTVNLSETASLNGTHKYTCSIFPINVPTQPVQGAIKLTWHMTYGVDVPLGKGLTIDLGVEDNPFEVGDTIRIADVIGTSNFEEVNADHEVTKVGGGTVAIKLGNMDAAEYTSGGTWQYIPNEQITFERFYVYTYIARMGTLLQEGPPSPVSTVLGLTNLSGVSLLDLSPPPANFNISRIRIYRTVLGNDSAEFKFVDEIGAHLTTYDDILLEGSTNLGEVLLSEDWGPPPLDLHSIVQMPNGIMAGLSKNEVFLTEPFQPHSWPDKYRRSMNFNGVSMGVFGNTVLITTDGNPYLLTGNDPGSMSMDKLELSQSCVAKRSTVDMGYSVVYASADGGVQVGPGIAKLVTESLFTKDEWQELNPKSIVAARWDDRYVGFYTKVNGDRGGFVFDPKNAEASFTLLSTIGETAYTEPDDADLYLVDNANNIVKFDSDLANDLDFVWLSKRFHLPRPSNFGAGMVHAESYPIGFTLYSVEKGRADQSEDLKVERFTTVVTDNRPFRMPSGFTSDEYQIELRGSTVIEAAYIAETLRELNLV